VSAWEAITAVATAPLLDAIALRPGERVLDVGCGVGAATMAAARAVGLTGEVTGVDISPGVVELARTRSRAADLGHAAQISFVVGDVQTVEVSDRFDAVMSQFGVMFFHDPVIAFSRLRRAMKPGGRLGFACWREADHNGWAIGDLLVDLLPRTAHRPDTAAPMPGPFSLADPLRIRSVLCDAGYDGIQIQSTERSVRVTEGAIVDADELAAMGVPAESIPIAMRRVRAALETFRRGDRYVLPVSFMVVVARPSAQQA
jgi:SAM-dependent methyltransferase